MRYDDGVTWNDVRELAVFSVSLILLFAFFYLIAG